jgi:hypothetical protein
MSELSIVPVDERDSAWEQPRPRFRVYLHGSGEASTGGWTATYDVTGAIATRKTRTRSRRSNGCLSVVVRHSQCLSQTGCRLEFRPSPRS